MDRLFLQVLSIILTLVGTYMLAFGLRVKTGITDDLRKELDIEKKGLISASNVRQRPCMINCGLGLITLASLIQIWIIMNVLMA